MGPGAGEKVGGVQGVGVQGQEWGSKGVGERSLACKRAVEGLERDVPRQGLVYIATPSIYIFFFNSK